MGTAVVGNTPDEFLIGFTSLELRKGQFVLQNLTASAISKNPILLTNAYRSNGAILLSPSTSRFGDLNLRLQDTNQEYIIFMDAILTYLNLKTQVLPII